MWLRIRLNNAGKYCDITLKIMVVFQNMYENCLRILEEEKHRQLRMFVILWKKWKKLAKENVNDDRYRAMLNEFLFTKIEEADIGNIGFQQDGATCHTAEATLDVLHPVFEDRIISRRADVVWSLRSWDLTPFDYYLWGGVKDKCYAGKPETIDALKDNIREAIGEI